MRCRVGEPTRRKVLAGAAGLAGVSVLAAVGRKGWDVFRQPATRVVTLAQSTYAPDLSRRLQDAIATFPRTLSRIQGGVVVLKPNLVEVHPGRPINTDARMVAAAVEAFRRLGAREVVVAEGPGHHRDTEGLVEWAGLGPLLRDTGARFVDLNVAPTVSVALPDDFSGLGSLQLPGILREADLVVSMPKLKTHHWVGATLAMKNLFGVVPGAVYGWPKNPLHHAGIHECIIDLWRAVAPGFAIVDGVVGMEGDGPIMGPEVAAGVIVMGEQLPAVDATAARMMGIDPERLGYLQVAARLGGTVSAMRIATDGEPVSPTPFALMDRWSHLRAG
jgi:uncharacterized protein (DUF362 family)